MYSVTLIASSILSRVPTNPAVYYGPSSMMNQTLFANSGLNSFASLLFICLFGFIMILSITIPILIGYFVYKDAKRHNIENPELWATISGITWIGLILYFVINKRDK